MPKTEKLVINIGPLLAIIAGLGDLSILERIYKRVLVPFEVCREIEACGTTNFGLHEFTHNNSIQKISTPLMIQQFISNTLDLGEASVIQLALNENIQTVCIDEAMGRRIARLIGLRVTGTIGILIRAQKEGVRFSMPKVIDRMQNHGIYLSQNAVNIVLEQTGERKQA